MKIYTTQMLFNRGVTETGKIEFNPVASTSINGHAYLDITVASGIKWLAPTWNMVKASKKGTLSQPAYKAIYLEMMEENFKNRPDRLQWLKDRKSLVLACYCKPGDFCHRYILAEFLAEKFGAERCGELKKPEVKKWLEALDNESEGLSPDEIAGQEREYMQLFLKQPENNESLEVSGGYMAWDRRSFHNDLWIFQGTESEPDIDGLFCNRGSDSVWAGATDNEHSLQAVRACRDAVPLKFGEVGAQSLDNKFKNSQMDRMIWEDCTSTGDGIKIPQLTTPGHTRVSSFLQVDKIAAFAGISVKYAAVVAKCYRELGFDFNMARAFNAKIRTRKVALPWDVLVDDKNSLVDLTIEMRHLNTFIEIKDASDPSYDDWMHYDDGIFEFKMVDDLAANAPNGLEEIEFSSYEEDLATDTYGDTLATELEFYQPSEFDGIVSMNNSGLFTYWNTSMIKRPDELCDKDPKSLRRFKKVLSAILDNELKPKTMHKLIKYIKAFTPPQKQVIFKAMCK